MYDFVAVSEKIAANLPSIYMPHRPKEPSESGEGEREGEGYRYS